MNREKTIHVPRSVQRAVKKMPAISPVLGKINEISQQMRTSPRDLVKIIMLDPVLTGKVIRLVNSSFYGLTHQVQSLAQAVVLLGMNTVKNVAISTALLSSVYVKDKPSPLPQDEFWRHCLAVAIAGKLLAKHLRKPPDTHETYFVSGLLHDVGKILLIHADHAKYTKALKEADKQGISLATAEARHFGCSHTDAGGLLVREWKLDEVLSEAIEHHHTPPGDTVRPVTEVVMAANHLCKEAGFGQSGNGVFENDVIALPKRLGVTPDMPVNIAAALPRELEKAEEFLNCINQ